MANNIPETVEISPLTDNSIKTIAIVENGKKIGELIKIKTDSQVPFFEYLKAKLLVDYQ